MTSTIETDEISTADGSTSIWSRSITTVVLVGAVGVVGVLWRWLVLRSSYGVVTADEAYTGIQSFEIVGGQFPIVLGGTAYTLPLEAYAYAPIAALVGTDIAMLKLMTTASWTLASIALYVVARHASSRRTGLIAGALCWVTPGALLLISVTSYSAYASGMLVTVVAFYVASIIVESDEPDGWFVVGFGALAGFGFWLHPMFVATLAPMVLVVLWSHRRRVRVWIGVIVGGLVGCAPLLLWNAKNSWPSLDPPTQVEGTYLQRIRTFGGDLMPRAFGLRNLVLEWQPNDIVGPVLYLALISLTIYGVVVAVHRSDRRSRYLLPAVLIGVFPIMALFENLIFAYDGRYGVISFPFVVLAMAFGVDALAGRTSPWRMVAVFGVIAAVWIGGLVVPTVRPLVENSNGDPNAHLRAAVAALDDAGIDRIYGSYWGVMPVDFAGDKRIVGGVFPFWPIRFPDRQRTVEATPIDEVAIVFVDTDEDPSRLPMPAEDYDRQVFGNIVMYVPTASSRAD